MAKNMNSQQTSFSDSEGRTDRVFRINDPQNSERFASNTIITSKYTWYNFLFKNLLEQFRHVSNIYFLLVMIVNVLFAFSSRSLDLLSFFQRPGMDIFSASTAVLPLVFILVVTAIKDAFEDVKRHRTDAETNAQPVRAFRDGRFRTILSKDVRVGDYIYVQRFSFTFVHFLHSFLSGIVFIEEKKFLQI